MGKARKLYFVFGAIFLCFLIIGFGPSNVKADLFVGNFFDPNLNVLEYNATTGAFVRTFVPTGSGGLTFPLGGGFGPDGNF